MAVKSVLARSGASTFPAFRPCPIIVVDGAADMFLATQVVDDLVVQDLAKEDIDGPLALFPAEAVRGIEERCENLSENIFVVETRVKGVGAAVVAHDSHGP